ncbi:hypothetical protein MPH_07390 [Macrophomina phaseolina MS6]|uniref:Uncharacterized protein n=1 Tax=Macrophomina phaseolina (strain MS6) TaxID=1126212 RepID=K2RL51_MACPH|nr:hypothetical protein MPH_07390 [Macrophomina phaseolina MS6]
MKEVGAARRITRLAVKQPAEDRVEQAESDRPPDTERLAGVRHPSPVDIRINAILNDNNCTPSSSPHRRRCPRARGIITSTGDKESKAPLRMPWWTVMMALLSWMDAIIGGFGGLRVVVVVFWSGSFGELRRVGRISQSPAGGMHQTRQDQQIRLTESPVLVTGNVVCILNALSTVCTYLHVFHFPPLP